MQLSHAAGEVRQIQRSAQQLTNPLCAPDLATSMGRAFITWLRNDAEFANLRDALPPDLQHHAIEHTAPWIDDRVRVYTHQRVSQWGAAVTELLGRLETDWQDLVNCFVLKADARLASISAPLGDLHNCGRAVYGLRFDDGRRLIYKPRSVEPEHTFGRLVEWLCLEGLLPELARCRVLPREGYGWSEYIDREYCTGAQEAARYYQRQGAFLALFWLLGASDAIEGNFIVHRDHPVWIDTECMCRPEFRFEIDSIRSVPDWIRGSILTSCMVYYGKQRNIPARHLTGLNVSCCLRRSETFFGGTLKAPYVEAAINGFRNTYTWLVEHREARCLAKGPLKWWRGRRVRVLLRPTALYQALIRLLTVTTRNKLDLVQRDIEGVLRSGEGFGMGPSTDDIVAAEMEALTRHDIPYWSVSTMSHDLYEAGGIEARGAASLTGMECIAHRISRMDGEDLDRQTWLMESYLGATPKRLGSLLKNDV